MGRMQGMEVEEQKAEMLINLTYLTEPKQSGLSFGTQTYTKMLLVQRFPTAILFSTVEQEEEEAIAEGPEVAEFQVIRESLNLRYQNNIAISLI